MSLPTPLLPLCVVIRRPHVHFMIYIIVVVMRRPDVHFTIYIIVVVMRRPDVHFTKVCCSYAIYIAVVQIGCALTIIRCLLFHPVNLCLNNAPSTPLIHSM
jgi:hypothetical protein